MARCIKLFLLVIVAIGCNTDNEEPTGEQLVMGKWNLTKVTNTSTGKVTIPDKSDTHYYQINSDGTFKRMISKKGTSNELIGNYVISGTSRFYGNEDNSIIKFVELNYTSEATFFNCNLLENNKQLLILTSDNLLQNTLDGACDGANYEYRKEKN